VPKPEPISHPVPKQEPATQYDPKGFEDWADQVRPLEPFESAFLGQQLYPNYQGNLIKLRQEIITSTCRNLLAQPNEATHTLKLRHTHETK
jgi:hypothetical protein